MTMVVGGLSVTSIGHLCTPQYHVDTLDLLTMVRHSYMYRHNINTHTHIIIISESK